MKHKHILAHMQAAEVYSKLSYCTRKQVGCVIVKDDRIISIGYNGTPRGWENVCESEDGSTKPTVIHAEANALAKLARSNESGEGATVFVTTAPCIHCAILLEPVDIKEVFYKEVYRTTEGIEFLEKCGIKVTQIK